jgi:hypothetical protein
MTASPLLHAPRVRAGRGQAHPDLAWSRLGGGQLADLQHLGCRTLRSYHAAIIVLVCRAAAPPFLAGAAPSPPPADTMQHRAGRISAGQRDLARH